MINDQFFRATRDGCAVSSKLIIMFAHWPDMTLTVDEAARKFNMNRRVLLKTIASAVRAGFITRTALPERHCIGQRMRTEWVLSAGPLIVDALG